MTPKTNLTTTISLRVPKELKEKLDKECERIGIPSRSGFIKMLITQYFNRQFVIKLEPNLELELEQEAKT